ncbi:MAG: ACT domain-containing protein [bacterium]|nr:ACT domain-containing protein [bacterium]
MTLTFTLLEDIFSICQLKPENKIPEWCTDCEFFSVTKSKEELSIVCLEESVPSGIKVDKGWRALKIDGVLDFSLTGILAPIATILANSRISIFAISTFNTDYILVKEKDLENAITILEANNYIINR